MIITVIAGKGSPGATTTALGMTLSWPTPVLLVEADPAGGSIRFGYGRGINLDGRGMAGIRVSARHMSSADAIWACAVTVDDDRWLLPDAETPQQARTLDYAGLADALASLGVDVIIDAGRVPATTDARPLLAISDHVMVALRATLPGVHTAQATAAAAVTTVAPGSVRSVIIGPGRPYPESDVAAAMTDVAPVAGTIAWDPVSAAVLSDGATRRRGFDRGLLMRSMKHLATVLTDGKDPDVETREPQPEPDESVETGSDQMDSAHDAPSTIDDMRLSAQVGGGRR